MMRCLHDVPLQAAGESVIGSASVCTVTHGGGGGESGSGGLGGGLGGIGGNGGDGGDEGGG